MEKKKIGTGKNKAAGKESQYLNSRRQIKPEGLSNKLNLLKILWFIYINKAIFC